MLCSPTRPEASHARRKGAGSASRSSSRRRGVLKDRVPASDLRPVRSHFSIHGLLGLAVGAVTFALAGCGAQIGAGGGVSSFQVTERDFAIQTTKHVAAGDVVLRVRNRGPGSHELLVVRASTDRLPFRSDGLTVDEDAVTKAEVGVLEPDHAGVVRELHVRLTPGRYVLFCNMSGHFLGGMHTDLVVR